MAHKGSVLKGRWAHALIEGIALLLLASAAFPSESSSSLVRVHRGEKATVAWPSRNWPTRLKAIGAHSPEGMWMRA